MNRNKDKSQVLVIKHEFAVLVHGNRLKNQITQEKLSEMIGITPAYLRCIENGKNAPNWIIWLKLCTALGVDVSEIQKKFKDLNL